MKGITVSDETVLVTGGSGFVATHCIARLLRDGYRVRATVRSLRSRDPVREAVREAGAEANGSLSFAVAELTGDDGWDQAAAGCAYVLHTASPFPSAQPKDENELIVPAREGTLRVLRAARGAGVRRVVVTSSFAAISDGHPETERAFTEQDWTDTDGPAVSAYAKSKTLAERAAWNFVDREGGGLKLSVVNPVGVFGPVTGSRHSTSIEGVKALMSRKLPAVPRLSFAVVDVRDVADLHLLAMTHPAAVGQRFIAAAGDAVSYMHIALTLREHLGDGAGRVPTRNLPDWVVRVAARAIPQLRELNDNLGVVRHVTNVKARTVLGWTPRSTEDAVIATAVSLLDTGRRR